MSVCLQKLMSDPDLESRVSPTLLRNIDHSIDHMGHLADQMVTEEKEKEKEEEKDQVDIFNDLMYNFMEKNHAVSETKKEETEIFDSKEPDVIMLTKKRKIIDGKLMIHLCGENPIWSTEMYYTYFKFDHPELKRTIEGKTKYFIWQKRKFWNSDDFWTCKKSAGSIESLPTYLSLQSSSKKVKLNYLISHGWNCTFTESEHVRFGFIKTMRAPFRHLDMWVGFSNKDEDRSNYPMYFSYITVRSIESACRIEKWLCGSPDPMVWFDNKDQDDPFDTSSKKIMFRSAKTYNKCFFSTWTLKINNVHKARYRPELDDRVEVFLDPPSFESSKVVETDVDVSKSHETEAVGGAGGPAEDSSSHSEFTDPFHIFGQKEGDFPDEKEHEKEYEKEHENDEETGNPVFLHDSDNDLDAYLDTDIVPEKLKDTIFSKVFCVQEQEPHSPMFLEDVEGFEGFEDISDLILSPSSLSSKLITPRSKVSQSTVSNSLSMVSSNLEEDCTDCTDCTGKRRKIVQGELNKSSKLGTISGAFTKLFKRTDKKNKKKTGLESMISTHENASFLGTIGTDFGDEEPLRFIDMSKTEEDNTKKVTMRHKGLKHRINPKQMETIMETFRPKRLTIKRRRETPAKKVPTSSAVLKLMSMG